MAFGVILPESKGSSSKDLIISVLSSEWPLSAKEIFSRVNKTSMNALSYQAIHKAILLLETEKVLNKDVGKYSLSISWAKELNEFSSFLLKNLSEGREVFPLNKELVFSSVFEVDQFLTELGKSLKPTKEDCFALQWSHLWVPLFFSKETYKEMKDLILASNYYCVCPADTPIDRWCEKFWHKEGAREKIGVKGISGIDMLVFRDVIVQVFYPPEIKVAIDKVYSSTKDPIKLDINEFFKTVFERKTKIPVLIIRNEMVAKELFEQTKEFFK
jgi:hypothetical protein